MRDNSTKTFSVVTPGTSATLLLAANAERVSALFVNAGSVTVSLGNTAGVTTGNGVPLPAGASLVDADSTDAWYGITASGTGDIRVIQVE